MVYDICITTAAYTHFIIIHNSSDEHHHGFLRNEMESLELTKEGNDCTENIDIPQIIIND